jgi:hypothetical protein
MTIISCLQVLGYEPEKLLVVIKFGTVVQTIPLPFDHFCAMAHCGVE